MTSLQFFITYSTQFLLISSSKFHFHNPRPWFKNITVISKKRTIKIHNRVHKYGTLCLQSFQWYGNDINSSSTRNVCGVILHKVTNKYTNCSYYKSFGVGTHWPLGDVSVLYIFKYNLTLVVSKSEYYRRTRYNCCWCPGPLHHQVISNNWYWQSRINRSC